MHSDNTWHRNAVLIEQAREDAMEIHKALKIEGLGSIQERCRRGLEVVANKFSKVIGIESINRAQSGLCMTVL